MKNYKYEIMCLGCAAMWGMAFPVTKFAGGAVDSLSFLVLKLLLGSIVLTILNFKNLKNICSVRCVLLSIAVGVLLGVFQLFQIEGLKYTSSANSSFITATNIMFVPILMLLFFRKKPTKNIVIGLIAIMTGFLFISGIISVSPFSFNLTELNYGDLLTLISAVLMAVYLIFFNKLAERYDETAVNCIHFIAGFAAMLVIWLFSEKTAELNSLPVILSVLYCGIFAGGIAHLLLAKAQAKLDESKVAILSGLEPVFATVFAVFIPDMNGRTEPITLAVIIGGTLIIYGAIKSTLVKK